MFLICQLQIMMPSIYFSVSQLTTLLEFFPPEEAYLRIQLIMVVFSHITDLENMYLIVDNVLTFDERNEVSVPRGISNLSMECNKISLFHC